MTTKYLRTPSGVRIEEYDDNGKCVKRTSTFIDGTDEYAANIPDGAQIEIDLEAWIQNAVQRGDDYITAQGFGNIERQELTALMAAGMLNENQMEKARAVLSWIMSIKTSAMTDPQNFNPTSNPPFTAQEVLS